MKTYLLLFLTVFFCYNIIAQTNNCGTPSDFPNTTSNDSLTSHSHINEAYCVDIAFHIVRPSDGSGGFDSNDIFQIMNNLNDRFNPLQIYFHSVGHDFIDSNRLFSLNGTGDEFDDLITRNNNPDALNFYLADDYSIYAGKSESILK